MHYTRVCLEAIAYTLPDEVVTSDEIEARLEPLYSRLRLPTGRLELMTGIRERRFWPRDMLPSEASAVTAEKAIQDAGLDRREIGALLHGSVCRDHLEPATACGVHHRLGLGDECLAYDVSNACLGILNGMLQVANMIELGQIKAGLIVGTESARGLVETTIDWLNQQVALTRDDVKPAVASLTIGSGSSAVLLVDKHMSRTGNCLLGAVARSNTRHHKLCHSGRDEAAGGGMRPLMRTDSERLLREGVATARQTFAALADATGWTPQTIDKTICHQVGAAHRKLLLESLELRADGDFSTFDWLGNTGSVALPMTAAIAAERGHLAPQDHVALLGIGSGINVVMLAVDWRQSRVGETLHKRREKPRAATAPAPAHR